MIGQDWQQLQELFERLGALGPVARSEALEQIGRAQPALAAELMSLLEQDAKARQWFDELEDDLDRHRAAELDAAWAPGRIVGPYRLERLLGTGGMGAVFLARKADGELRRPVALKLIPSDSLPEDGGERLRHERDVLASLAHPNIAHLHDAGLDDAGQPWIAMEFVDGPRIDRWIRDASPGLDERLDRFLELCEAVAAAHRKLIVHGDIKPANVLLDGNARVRLLDFGIARLLQQRSDSEASVRYLSPSYAAPELELGAPASVASDIFAIGRVLDQVLRGLPERPAEIDSIVARACDPDPERRHSSVTRLIDDIEDLRAGRPVASHSGATGYRFMKWFGRNRLAAVTGLFVFALVLGFAVHSIHQADRYQAERDKALAVGDFLQEVFASADPERSRGEQLTAIELLESGVARIDALAVDGGVRADVLSVMAQSLQHLGEYSRAIELLGQVADLHRDAGRQQSQAEALIVLAETFHADGQFDAAEASFEQARRLLDDGRGRRARLLRAEAMAKLGRMRIQAGSVDSGLSLLEDALRLARSDADLAPEALAERLNDAASGHWRVGEHAQALALIEQALVTRRALDQQAGRPSPETATLISNAGLMYYLSGQAEPAEERFEEALRIRRRVLPEDHPDIAQTLTNHGLMLKDFSRLDEAVSMLEEALAIRRRGLRPGHVGIAEAELNLAGALHRNDALDRAEPLFESAIAGLERELGDEHPSVAVAYNDHAAMLLDLGRPAAAETAYRQAQRIRDRVLPADHPHQAWSLIGLARALIAQDRAAEAQPLVERAVAIRQRLPTAHPHRTEAEDLLAGLERRTRN